MAPPTTTLKLPVKAAQRCSKAQDQDKISSSHRRRPNRRLTRLASNTSTTTASSLSSSKVVLRKQKHPTTYSTFTRTIRFTSSFNDKHALVVLLNQHGRHLIDKMTFCMRPQGFSPNKAIESGRISPTARDLLSGRVIGPSLKRIDIECDFELPTKSTLKFERDVTALFAHPKDEDTLLQLEADDPRRRLLAEAWAALAQNAAVQELGIGRFVPLWTSTFHTAQFRALLARLTSLHLNIYGAKHGRSINTIPAYNNALQSTLKVLLLHAHNLEHLALHASQHAPLGARANNYHIPLSLKATQLPKLKHLSLKHCFIGFELAHFINAHAATLETLTLHNCYGYRGEGVNDSGMSWAAFLGMITRGGENGGMRLRRFVIVDDHIPLTGDDKRLKGYDPDTANEPVDVRRMRRMQRTSTRNLRLFLYAFLRDYSGELWMNKDAMMASFEAMEDQRAYENLMKVVRRNEEGGMGGNMGKAIGGGGYATRCEKPRVHFEEVVEIGV